MARKFRGSLAWAFVASILMSITPALADTSDIHSQSHPEAIRVTHLALRLNVDFKAKALTGTATLSIARSGQATDASRLVLDTRGLEILSVSADDGTASAACAYELGEEVPFLGRALSVSVPKSAKSVTVKYRTTERSTALQWLDPKGTAGGEHPFLFSQSQAIHARTWIPIQDTPGVRVTYNAEIEVPGALAAVMSAERTGEEVLPGGRKVFRFAMRQPIPAYLIALAVGDLAFRPLGPRTGVFAEPSVVEAAAKEFEDTEAMVSTVEKRFGPYRWGRYDLLVLPPSFPFGGMENPRLTFATPTILAGDKSLVSLVAHELAHSWSGNLVTNATWRDFWLNEGFTTYLERRVMEDLYGPERAAMERVLGLGELKEELAAFPPRDQILHVDLQGRDPDEGMTRIPYEKGALFLSTLEAAFGREVFDEYLRSYFDRHAFQSITTETFVKDLRENLLARDPAAASKIDVERWIDAPGLPGGYPEPRSDRFAAVEAVARQWSDGKDEVDAGLSAQWTSHEWVHFLQALPERMPADRLKQMDDAYKLTARGNSEVLHAWLLIATRNQYQPAEARVDAFLTTVGRRKFLVPLYAELLKTPEGRQRAKSLFARARPFYHPISAEAVAKLIGPDASP